MSTSYYLPILSKVGVRAMQSAAVALTAPAVASKAISACVVPEALDKVTVQYNQKKWIIAAISEFAKAKALSVKQAFNYLSLFEGMDFMYDPKTRISR